MVAVKQGECFDLAELSDGERCMIALAGDLSRRLALAHPGSMHPLQEKAVVIIDEVELHLHPAWQRSIVGRLREIFPNCQFILTTHSPQVIASAPTNSLRVLSEWKVWATPAPTEGRDSNSILSEVMNAGERPAATEKLLNAIEKHLSLGKYTKAQKAITELEARWGPLTPEVVRLRTMLSFLRGEDAPRS
jgi:predicted ATP-binding protein involved in virulence